MDDARAVGQRITAAKRKINVLSVGGKPPVFFLTSFLSISPRDIIQYPLRNRDRRSAKRENCRRKRFYPLVITPASAIIISG